MAKNLFGELRFNPLSNATPTSYMLVFLFAAVSR